MTERATPNDRTDHEADINRRLARVWRDSRLGPTVENLRRQVLRVGNRSIELAQYRLLHALNEHGPMPMRTLADTVGSTQSSVSRTVQRLEQLGLATKEQSKSDLRSYTVSATEEGLRTYSYFVDRAYELYEEIFAVFSLSEREQLAALLERLLKSADSTLADDTTRTSSED